MLKDGCERQTSRTGSNDGNTRSKHDLDFSREDACSMREMYKLAKIRRKIVEMKETEEWAEEGRVIVQLYTNSHGKTYRLL